MNLTVAALLAALHAAPAAAEGQPLLNLDFGTGRLERWEGEGFTLGPANRSGPTLHQGVSSADRNGPNGPRRTAILHRTFTLPPDAGMIRFWAAAVRPAGVEGVAGQLEVYLEAAGRDMLPRQVWHKGRWDPSPLMLNRERGGLRCYSWAVDKHAGKRVRIAIVDNDSRPGCHLVCGGFNLIRVAPPARPQAGDSQAVTQFVRDMRDLQKKHRLARVRRYDTRHFVALSNADSEDSTYRLSSCETIYSAFYRHFRNRGLEAGRPREKMMVAIFNTQEGMEAYMGQKMSSAITGLYHPGTNRLLVYDYGTNRAFLAGKKQLDEHVSRARSDVERSRRLVATGRFLLDRRAEANTSTVMHEVAHQLAFNGGLMNRKGDVPLWLAEGLAVYCEATIDGSWQGIGEPNPSRARSLASTRSYIPLQDLVQSDDWFRRTRSVERAVLGYAQSWALFRMLMEQRPAQLRTYLQTIYHRRTPDHRLADFGQAFGADLKKLEKRYLAYLREVGQREGSSR